MLIAPRDDRVQLRAFVEDDLPFLDRLCTDIDALGAHEWPGFMDVRTRRKRWEEDGYIGAQSALLAVVLPGDMGDGGDRGDKGDKGDKGDTVAGIVSWRAGRPDGAHLVREIGCGLLPDHRGQGLGTRAQRLLVAHLFAYTRVERVEAITDSENFAEQKSLQRIGFQLEGVLRHRNFQHGSWRDHQLYALLRDEWESAQGE